MKNKFIATTIIEYLNENKITVRKKLYNLVHFNFSFID